ncbi:isopropylmalate/homocitrate/citramalate synthase [Pseudorhizobium tarimense]|uniref:Isopropylmalate/homocitrate/citramalate synthase n=1 Tax=Pseudorhizobium tarimense TaxID=1079109 RepID=A0ABV2HD26_9HYPH
MSRVSWNVPSKDQSSRHVARVVGASLPLDATKSVGDTLGKGRPDTIASLLDAVLAIAPVSRLAGHYHDTNGRAAESIEVSLIKGLRVFDSSIAGLGGCPYAPGAKGNFDTVKVDALLRHLGYCTALDEQQLAVAAAFAHRLKDQNRHIAS